MTEPMRHRLRRLRRGLWYALAAALVLMALGNAVGSQLLGLAGRHPDRIAAWLSARAQRPVAFDHVDTRWTRRGPLLRLDNLRIGEGTGAIRIGDAEVLVAQYAGLLPGRSFTELRVRGLDLVLQRDDAGRWSVRGLPGQQQGGGDPFATLERLGELQVPHARLRVLAPALGIDTTLPRIDLRLQARGPRIRAGARAWLRAGGSPLEMALEFDRVAGTGRVYAGSRRADLAELGGKVALAGVAPAAGRGRLRAWARLDGGRVVALRAEGGLEGVVLRGVPAARAAAAPRLAMGEVALDAQWRGSLAQWRLDAPRLRIGRGEAAQVLDGLALAGGRHYGLQARRVDAAPLLALLALGDGVGPGLRGWLRAAAPGAVLENVALRGVRGGPLHVHARVRGLAFAPVGRAPGMRGVSGELEGDAEGLRLRLDPAATATFDWPAGFGVPHAFSLDGEVVAWRDAGGWSVRTPALALAGPDLSLKVRGGIGFPADGGRPRLDLAADIADTPVAAARGFWVHHLMPKATIDWLEAALQGGTLRDIHAVVVGDLRDWPFRSEPGLAGAGRFRVDARLDDATLRFHRDWPAAERVQADLRFDADGFTVAGKGRLLGVPIAGFSAGIPRFGHAELSVDARGAGDARDFLALLRASPLQREYGETLSALAAAGPASTEFHLRLPLYRGAPPSRLEGTVALAGASLRETRWALAFDDVRGQARYDNRGFVAEDLRVRHGSQPGRLALRAGPHVRDPAQAFEAELQATLGIDELLDKAGTSLGWLKPWLDGRSPWTVGLAVPRGQPRSAPPSRLRLRSSLVGTAVALPLPLRKPAGQPLAASVDVALPLERGEVAVALGNLLSLRSRSFGDRTGVRLRLGGESAPAPTAPGLWVDGRAQRLEALDWIGVVAGGGGGAMPLRRVDVQARQLRLLGADFADARVVLAPAARGTAVQVQAATLAGALLVPDQEGATVAGRFERFHWNPDGLAAGLAPAADPAAAAGAVAVGPKATPAAATASADDPAAFDPAHIPPLLFDIGDLRIGAVVLGSARFRSAPTAAGLRLDELSTRGGRQRLGATGSWTGSGAGARTRLRLGVDSDDLGALLAGLGLGGQLAGGKGRLDLDAGWGGGPDAFDPQAMDARLALDARDGRLLEIEPGAGRVLGLLGIAQLPRRLTLDFRDFFDKGFAFDRLHGQVRLAQGVARTDDLAIEGPAADIRVHGSADLRTRRFDQTVDVLPKSGGLLTAAGALVGGPVGAAVGAVANAVLDKPLQGLSARTYRVSGPWDAPKVEVVERGPAATRRPPAAPAPAPAPQG